MKKEYLELREKYPTFIYRSYEIQEQEENYLLIYHFEITGLEEFAPTIEIPKKFLPKLDEYSKSIIFHIGLVELISYWKATCSKKVVIEAGYLNKNQIEWFKKLYYYGLGEFFYRNQIDVTMKDFMEIISTGKEEPLREAIAKTYHGKGNLIPIGGGKDSCVTLEILKSEKENNTCFLINPKPPMQQCATLAGYSNQILSVNRKIDRKIVSLNEKGFLNGHTPFSALVAFLSYLLAYENDKEYIVLSNEDSANEETVLGKKINHQYSKTLEFERDFRFYTQTYFSLSIRYFSLLRPCKEILIAKLFSHYTQYHEIFRSCNLGSKEKDWPWCGNCPKCLFIFILLSPWLYKEKLVSIFKEDLLERKDLLSTFQELIGELPTKPFECVGSIDEVNASLVWTIEQETKKGSTLPYLLSYYQKNKKNEISKETWDSLWQLGREHEVEEPFYTLLEKEVKKYE